MIREALGYEPGESIAWDLLIALPYIATVALGLYIAIPNCDAAWLSRTGGIASVGALLILQRANSLQTRRFYGFLECFSPNATSSDLRLRKPNKFVQEIATSVAIIGTATWAFSDVTMPMVCGG